MALSKAASWGVGETEEAGYKGEMREKTCVVLPGDMREVIASLAKALDTTRGRAVRRAILFAWAYLQGWENPEEILFKGGTPGQKSSPCADWVA